MRPLVIFLFFTSLVSATMVALLIESGPQGAVTGASPGMIIAAVSISCVGMFLCSLVFYAIGSDAATLESHRLNPKKTYEVCSSPAEVSALGYRVVLLRVEGDLLPRPCKFWEVPPPQGARFQPKYVTEKRTEYVPVTALAASNNK